MEQVQKGTTRNCWLMALLTPEGAGCTCRSRLRKVLIQVCCHDTPCLAGAYESRGHITADGGRCGAVCEDLSGLPAFRSKQDRENALEKAKKC